VSRPTPKRGPCKHCGDRISIDPSTGRLLLHSQGGTKCKGSYQPPKGSEA
jgi:hypothetical protein